MTGLPIPYHEFIQISGDGMNEDDQQRPVDLDIVCKNLVVAWYSKVVVKGGMGRTRMCISIPDRSEVYGQLVSANSNKEMSEKAIHANGLLTYSLQLMAGFPARAPPVRMDGRTQSLSRERLSRYSIVAYLDLTI